MSDNPYTAPGAKDLEPVVPTASPWNGALVGGLTAVALTAVGGTLQTNVAVWLYMAWGYSPQDAYTQWSNFSQNPYSGAILVSLGLALLYGFLGGVLAARHGRGKTLFIALGTCGIQLFCGSIMLLLPQTMGYLTPNHLLAFFVGEMFLLIGACLGAWLVRRRQRAGGESGN